MSSNLHQRVDIKAELAPQKVSSPTSLLSLFPSSVVSFHFGISPPLPALTFLYFLSLPS